MYEYNAEVIRVVDGDTLVTRIDLGFDVHVVKTVRLVGVDTPELKGSTHAAGIISKVATEKWVHDHQVDGLVVCTYKDKSDGFGRWLADVCPAWGGTSLSDYLVINGFAVVYRRGN